MTSTTTIALTSTVLECRQKSQGQHLSSAETTKLICKAEYHYGKVWKKSSCLYLLIWVDWSFKILRNVNLMTRAHCLLSYWLTIYLLALDYCRLKEISICTILLCNIAPVRENLYFSYDLNLNSLIRGSIRVQCQLGPMKKHFPNQHPSDILVAF